MKIEIVTHLGGGPATAGCTDVLDCDMYTAAKASVTCRKCINGMQSSLRQAHRFVVDYNADKATWGVYDRRQSQFVTSATTRASAAIQRRRMRTWYK